MHLQLQRLLNTLCSLLCATALFAIMVLTFFDVGGRKLMSQSIPGSLELTELLMVIVIFAGLPLVSERGEHVLFDSLDSVWPAWFVKIQKALVHLLCAVLMLALAWLMWKLGAQYMANNDQTAQLQIPKSPFVFGMSLMCAITGVLHLVMTLGSSTESDETTGAAL
jgi:TRAP-type transport system small permease protein